MGHGQGGGPSAGSWGSSTVQHWEPLPRLLGFAVVAELLRGAHCCLQPRGQDARGDTRPCPQQLGAARAACSTRPRPPRRQMLGRAREEDGKYLKT